MYFEPTKKTYYRFPSISSINDLDSKYYFPEKTYVSGENTHFDTKSQDYAASHDSNHHF